MVESKNLFYSTCFRPLDVWMRCLGIQLNPFPSAPSSKFKSICLYSFGFLMFFINVSSNMYFTIVSFTSPLKSTQKTFTASTSDIWSRIIDFGSHNLMAIGNHATLLALTREPEWKLLWHNLQQLAAEHGQFFYSKSRRVVTVGLLCLTAVMTILQLMSFYFNWITLSPVQQDVFGIVLRAIGLIVYNNGRPLLLLLADVISILSEIFAISGLAVFITICWITSVRFELLHDQLNQATDPIGQRNSPSSRRTMISTTTDLRRWRRTYVKLTETVMHIGQCFGPLILIWIVYVFISFIAISFYIVDGVHREFVTSTISFMVFVLVRHLVHLLVLATIPVILKQKVSFFFKEVLNYASRWLYRCLVA